MMHTTLREYLNQAHETHKRRHLPEWRWEDEDKIYVLQDYALIIGGIEDMTEDDYKVCAEYGIDMVEIEFAFSEED